MRKMILVLIAVILFGCASSGPAEDGNYVRNGDFSRTGTEWNKLPTFWTTSWKGGDGYEPFKTEDGRFVGWAENNYGFTLAQNISGLEPGTYTLSADFRLNPDSDSEEITMNVYDGRTLIASKSIQEDLLSREREVDYRFELSGINVTGKSVRIEFTVNNMAKFIGIDNVVFR